MSNKSIPRWVTSWPDWFGVFGNVEVVPASDYEAAEKAMRALFALLDRDLTYDHTGTVMMLFENLDQAMNHIADARRAAAVPRDDIGKK